MMIEIQAREIASTCKMARLEALLIKISRLISILKFDVISHIQYG